MKTTAKTIIFAALMAIATAGQAQNKNLYDQFIERNSRLYEVAYFSHYDIGDYHVEITLIRSLDQEAFDALRQEFRLTDEDIKGIRKTYGKTLLVRDNGNPRQNPVQKNGKVNLRNCCFISFSPREKTVIVFHSLDNTKKKEAIAKYIAAQSQK